MVEAIKGVTIRAMSDKIYLYVEREDDSLTFSLTQTQALKLHGEIEQALQHRMDIKSKFIRDKFKSDKSKDKFIAWLEKTT